jgi:hypothetical protein
VEVINTGPSSPAAKQVVEVGQLIAKRLLPLGRGFCQFQAPPAEIGAGAILGARGGASRAVDLGAAVRAAGPAALAGTASSAPAQAATTAMATARRRVNPARILSGTFKQVNQQETRPRSLARQIDLGLHFYLEGA